MAGLNSIQTSASGDPVGDLSRSEIERYGRHLILGEIGLAGQRKLKAARVLVVGAGGLGSPVALYLAAAGVGTIGLVDFDQVEVSNLQRQIIHGQNDIGRAKVDSARDRLATINPQVAIITHQTRLTSANALAIIGDYDLVVDGTDNFPTRYLVNDACVLLGKPNIYGSIFKFEGQASVLAVPGHACYRCWHPRPPAPSLVPSCAEAGVLGVLPGLVGTIQATEAIKLILGGAESLIDRLLYIDAWTMRFREIGLARDPACPVCGDRPTIRELIDYEDFCGLKKPEPLDAEEMTVTELKQALDQGQSYQIIDVREPSEWSIASLAQATLIPLGQVVDRRGEIDPTRTTVVMCKGGVRSARAIEQLRAAGFAGRMVNLVGGIAAWSDQIDSQVPKY